MEAVGRVCQRDAQPETTKSTLMERSELSAVAQVPWLPVPSRAAQSSGFHGWALSARGSLSSEHWGWPGDPWRMKSLAFLSCIAHSRVSQIAIRGLFIPSCGHSQHPEGCQWIPALQHLQHSCRPTELSCSANFLEKF